MRTSKPQVEVELKDALVGGEWRGAKLRTFRYKYNKSVTLRQKDTFEASKHAPVINKCMKNATPSSVSLHPHAQTNTT